MRISRSCIALATAAVLALTSSAALAEDVDQPGAQTTGQPVSITITVRNGDGEATYDLSSPSGVTDAANNLRDDIAQRRAEREAERERRLQELRDSIKASTNSTRERNVSATVSTDHTTTTVSRDTTSSVSYDSDSGLSASRSTNSSLSVSVNAGGGSSGGSGSGSADAGPDEQATGSVTVEYVTSDGTVLKARSYVRENARVGRSYYTSQLSFAGYEFAGMASGSAPASGVVAEGEQHVVYVYQKVAGVSAASSAFDGAVTSVAEVFSGDSGVAQAAEVSMTGSVPATGDSTPTALIAVVLGVAVAVIVGAVLLRRRR